MQEKGKLMPGERLRAAREAAGRGQRELSEACFYAKSTVSNVERGRRTLSIAAARTFGNELNVSAAWLLGLDEPEISYETALAVIVAQGRQEEAARELDRDAYGFEIDRNFYRQEKDVMLKTEDDGQMSLFEEETT